MSRTSKPPARAVLLEDLRMLAQRQSASTVARELDELLAQSGQRSMTVVVAGQYSRGKTTLVNALLGRDLLPVGLLPVTAVPTTIANGAERSARVLYLDGREETIAFDALPSVISEAANPKNVFGVRRVDLELPDWPFANVRFVDAPGVSTPGDTGGHAADGALRLADLAILVVGPEPPITAAELAFAATVQAMSQRLFVVLNKADLAGPAIDEVVAFTRERLVESLSVAPPLYPLDARKALSAHGDPRFKRFRRDLETFISAHGDETLDASIDRRALVLSRELLQMIELERAATAAPRDARLDALVKLQEIEIELRTRRAELIATYRTALAGELDALQTTTDEWIASEGRVVAARLQRFVSAGDADGLRNELDDAGADALSRWSSKARARLESAGAARGERLLRALRNLRAEAMQPVLTALGSAQSTETPTPPVLVIAPLQSATSYATTGSEVALQAVFRLLPGALQARMLRGSEDRWIAERLDRERGRLMAASREVMSAAGEMMARRVAGWFDEQGATIRAAIERAANVDDADVIARIAELDTLRGAVLATIAHFEGDP